MRLQWQISHSTIKDLIMSLFHIVLLVDYKPRNNLTKTIADCDIKQNLYSIMYKWTMIYDIEDLVKVTLHLLVATKLNIKHWYYRP
jgi:hypothetical protein